MKKSRRTRVYNYIEQKIGFDQIKFVRGLTDPWYSRSGLLGLANRGLRSISEFESGGSYLQPQIKANKKILSAYPDFIELAGDCALKDAEGKQKMELVQIAILDTSSGILLDDFNIDGWGGESFRYSLYKFDLIDDFSVYMVLQKSTSSSPQWMPFVYVDFEGVDFFTIFKEWFWKTVSNASYFYPKQAGMSVVIAPEVEIPFDLDEPYISEYPENYFYSYWNKFKKKGISRSLLLFGPPGTGKTSVIRRMAKSYDLKFSRVSPALLGNQINEKVFKSWYSLFKPDIILFDDVHAVDSKSMLSLFLSILEYVNKSISVDTLMVGTANDLSNVDLALLRPERFDASFHFTNIGKEKEILESHMERYQIPNLSKSKMSILFESIQGLSAASIKECAKTLSALWDGENQNESWIESDEWDFILDRINLMKKMSDKDEIAKISNVAPGKPSIGFGNQLSASLRGAK
jgi:GTPase SAR1 family protein